MSQSTYHHCVVSGIKTVIPPQRINIDDELEFFDNSPKKLARQKKMVGYGTRYIADQNTTVTDMATYAAERLMDEMGTDRKEIDLLVFVNQHPDYIIPCDACLAHDILKLPRNVTSLNLNLGCSGYPSGLEVAHSLVSSGNYKKCLLLAGDIPARDGDLDNRKTAPVFGDAASATLLEYSSEPVTAHFASGTAGEFWDVLVHPFRGARIRLADDFRDRLTKKQLQANNIFKGEEVFELTMEIAPLLLENLLRLSGWSKDDVFLYAIHQANKQIIDNIVNTAGIPPDRAPTDTFTKYANNSTNSVVTVLCDNLDTKNAARVILCTFGVGFLWAGAALDLSKTYNGGIATYQKTNDVPPRDQLIEYFLSIITGE